MEYGKTLGELVQEDPRWAEVFYRKGLDFCCGGRRTLEEACREAGIHPEELEKALSEIEARPEGLPKRPLSPRELCDYIEEVFHEPLRRDLEEIEPLLEKLVRVHGEGHPELASLLDVFRALRDDIHEHLRREEEVLFPPLRSGEEISEEVKKEFLIAEEEHDKAGELLQKMRELTQGYCAPEDGCATYRYAFERLEKLEKQLFLHIHLENNVLFPHF